MIADPDLKQIILDVISTPKFSSSNYFISQSNKLATNLVNQWPEWPQKQHLLYAPSGYGKTHLAHIFQQRSSATYIDAATLDIEKLNNCLQINKGTIIVDNIGSVKNEETLFHLYNHIKSQNLYALYISNKKPAYLNLTLPDLSSRLKALPIIEIEPADDMLLEAVVTKWLGDLQIKISKEARRYLLTQIPRNLSDIKVFMQKLNEVSLRDKRNITIPFVKQILVSLYGDF